MATQATLAALAKLNGLREGVLARAARAEFADDPAHAQAIHFPGPALRGRDDLLVSDAPDDFIERPVTERTNVQLVRGMAPHRGAEPQAAETLRGEAAGRGV